MPAKKNTKKRARDNGDDTSGPPKKRVKKVKNSSGSLRRSARNKKQPKEYWKIDENDDDSDESDTTYLPATRRTRSSRSNSNHNKKSVPKQQSKKAKRAKPSNKTNNKTKTNKKKSSERKTENEESSELSDDSASESVDSENITIATTHNHHESNSEEYKSDPPQIEMRPKQRRNNHDIDVLSPHKSHTIHDLPQKIDAMLISQETHSKSIQSLSHNASYLKSIKNILMQSDSIQKTQSEITQRIAAEINDLSKTGDVQKKELNKNIEESNKKYQALQKMFEENMENIYSKVDKIGEDTNENDIDANNEYKVLYETSLKKVKLLNDDLMNVKHEMNQKNDERMKQEKQRESAWNEMENDKRKEIEALKTKYLMEIDECKVELKCVKNEYHEYKQKMDNEHVINDNNQNLLIDNLKRENKALLTELTNYRQKEATQSPDSKIITPVKVNTNYNDYRKHIEDSPLNQRIQNELITISNTKQLENKIMNLNEEIASYKTQLFAKKELIKEFQNLLETSHAQQKQLLIQREKDVKVMNVYEILTSTKMEIVNKTEDEQQINNDNDEIMDKQEQFKCRTVYKENESMIEYYLSLEETDENAVCDYNLISSHNLAKPLNDSLVSCITFYTKDAPLFLKKLIQEIFIRKKP